MNYGLRPAGDRHDGLAIAEQMEEVIEELLASDMECQCGRARRILALRYPKISFIHCFAHDIYNLVEAVLKTVFQQISADAAGVASYLNTSTSKWLVRAMKAMHKRYGASFAIFTLCETRWNSMQACFASLLRARGALEDIIFSYRNSNEMTEKLRVLGKNEFWTKLETAEKIVRPLCTASFHLQRDENTVADVVLSYMEIYRGFASTEFSDSLVELVETRWNACEQPLFILGFFLHPEYAEQARQLPSTVLTTLDDVSQFAQYYYRRFVDSDDTGLRGEMFTWFKGSYSTSRAVDFKKDSVVTFWEYERDANKDSKLPVLALTSLSVAVNTATCERLFSELALIPTPKRNRMSIRKTAKHQIMRQFVREKNRREKVMPTASKKLLRTIDPRERPCITTPQNSARSTPARTTPARTTPAQTTAARTTAASTTPARTTSSNPTPAAAETPSQEPGGIFTTPNRQIQAQLHSAPPARVLLPSSKTLEQM
ncbi:hypothetical protein PPTG_07982 [Phytophthora nicotianae INRA-310]|uniref:HAT C-terminal dimerisation domain-containing protein n=1 Tax=Phytophthora nicotianae (strain INRA-310) TaxID=761204 RepID=W2QN46_PHYN3|nr:hypothetical protein PPTG_07982 [Phytophthora nicotianae INRA-310]ETN14366.1 hypothetical protein PPTG_07982 [Phytophthora nicotianae INRA-310]